MIPIKLSIPLPAGIPILPATIDYSLVAFKIKPFLSAFLPDPASYGYHRDGQNSTVGSFGELEPNNLAC